MTRTVTKNLRTYELGQPLYITHVEETEKNGKSELIS